MLGKDIRDITVTELGRLAEEIRSTPTGKRKARRLADKMCAASGDLGQLLWWAKDTIVEAPPDAKAKLFVMPTP